MSSAVPVAGLSPDGCRLLAGADRLLEPPHLPQRDAEVVQRGGFPVGRPLINSYVASGG